MGEGGMIATENEGCLSHIKTMRLHGINRHVFDRFTSDKTSCFDSYGSISLDYSACNQAKRWWECLLKQVRVGKNGKYFVVLKF